MDVIVLGPGCAKCASTVAMIERVAKELGVPVAMTKIEDRDEIIRRGVKATPAVMVGGVLVHSGGIPAHQKVQSWLQPAPLDLLNHTTEDSPTLAFEDYLPEDLPTHPL